ncbi:MAG: hypothetical protein ACI4II_00925 [Acutalibacteraceae bacterium]
MDFQIGQIVCSRSGHDKGCFYVVVDVKDGFAYVCNGRNRLLDCPKKKNFRHLAPTTMSLPQSSIETNHEIRKSLAAMVKSSD